MVGALDLVDRKTIRIAPARAALCSLRGGHPVAKDLGKDEDWLRDISIEMEIEDRVISVHGVGGDGVKAFTDFAIENLIELIRFYKDHPVLLRQ